MAARTRQLAYSKALKRKVRLVIWLAPEGGHRLFFATDTALTGREVMDIYRTRFQTRVLLP